MTTSKQTRKHLATSPREQQGIALIAVVMILILVSLVGVLSMRYSNLNQRISKNAQAKKLLNQSADVPIALLSSDSASNDLTNMLNTFGPLGLLRKGVNAKNEYVLCYQPMVRNTLYDQENKHLVLTQSPSSNRYGETGNTEAYCDLTTDSYTSKRKLVVTQVAVTRPNQYDYTNSDEITTDQVVAEAFITAPEGTSFQGSEQGVYYRTYSTSIIPSLADASVSNDDINDCMKKPMGGLAYQTANDESLYNCLENDLGVPFTTQVQDFAYIPEYESN